MCAERSAYPRIETATFAGLGDLFVDLELSEVANRFFIDSIDIATKIGYRFLILYGNLQRAWLTALANNARQAMALLDEASDQAIADRSTYERGIYELTAGRIHLLHGQPEAAIPLLKKAVSLLGDDVYIIEILIAQLYMAAALQSKGNEAEATDLLTTTLKRVAAFQYRFMILSAVQPIVETLRSISTPASLAMQRDAISASRWRYNCKSVPHGVRSGKIRLNDLQSA